MRKNKDEYSKLITEEMGKPVRQATAEVEKCAWLCDYYSETAEAFLRDELIPTEFRKSFVCFEPIGVVAGIMPWNFPFWQAMRFAVPAVGGLLPHLRADADSKPDAWLAFHAGRVSGLDVR